MAKKIRDAAIKEWVLRGNVEMLDKYWKHPEMVAYRARALVNGLYQRPTQNAWCHSLASGKTLVFLLERDPEVQRAHKDIVRVDYWSNIFFQRCWHDFWPMLDIGPPQLRHALALPTLDLLMRAGHTEGGEYKMVHEVRSKISAEVHAFYQKFEQRYPLTALAWIDNDHLWKSQRPMMANLTRHAASCHPEDVLGAYLIWSHDLALHLRQSQIV